MSKKEISIDQFRALIKEEAIKINQKAILENEKKKLIEELNECSIVSEQNKPNIMESTETDFLRYLVSIPEEDRAEAIQYRIQNLSSIPEYNPEDKHWDDMATHAERHSGYGED